MVSHCLAPSLLTQATVVHLSRPTFLFFKRSAAPGPHWVRWILTHCRAGRQQRMSSHRSPAGDLAKPSWDVEAPVRAAPCCPKQICTTGKQGKSLPHTEEPLFSFVQLKIPDSRGAPLITLTGQSLIPLLLAPPHAVTSHLRGCRGLGFCIHPVGTPPQTSTPVHFPKALCVGDISHQKSSLA